MTSAATGQLQDTIPSSSLDLQQALLGNDVARVQQLLVAGADVKAVVDGAPMLHFAACSGTVRVLLAAGADIHAVDNKGCTALDNACQSNNPDKYIVVLMLLDAGAVVSAGTVFLAAKSDAEQLRSVSTAGIGAELPQWPGTAVLQQHSHHPAGEATAAQLVADASSAACHPTGIGGSSSSSLCVDAPSQAQLPRTAGGTNSSASSNILQLVIQSAPSVDVQDKEGRSALYWAASSGTAGAAELLLAAGANAAAACYRGMTPLHAAARADESHVLECLLRNATGLASLHQEDWRGYTPLHHAAANHTVSLCEPGDSPRAAQVRLLLEHGASPNSSSVHRYAIDSATPLLVAVCSDRYGLGSRCEVWSPEQMHAVEEVVCLLLQYGADPNLVPPSSRPHSDINALAYAAQSGLAGAVRLLLEAGARTSSLLVDMHDALHLALATGHANVVSVLLNSVASGAPTVKQVEFALLSNWTALKRPELSPLLAQCLLHLQRHGGINGMVWHAVQLAFTYSDAGGMSLLQNWGLDTQQADARVAAAVTQEKAAAEARGGVTQLLIEFALEQKAAGTQQA